MSELTPKALNFTPAAISTGVSNITYISGPTYVGPNSINLLFPFSLSNGVLNLNLVNNFSLSTGVPQKMGATVRLSGTSKNVTSIGSNLRTYIKNCTWGTNTIPDASSITVHTPATMTMVQQLDETFIGQLDGSPYSVTSGPPPSNFALQFSGFGITYVFLTPLVLKARNSSGNNFYITLFSSWDRAGNTVG
jgi:hypothetical protein